MRARRQKPTRAWVTRNTLHHAAREYEQSGNPAYAWDAIATCLSTNTPLPAWTREYLLHAASQITQLSRDKVPHKNRIAASVSAALGFSGRGRRNPFRAMADTVHELMIAFDVYTTHAENRQNQRKGIGSTHDWRTVFTDAARNHHAHCDECRRVPSWQTMERYWRRHALAVIPGHLRDRALSQKIDDILR